MSSLRSEAGSHSEVDLSKGIYQAIGTLRNPLIAKTWPLTNLLGYKEFAEYLHSIETTRSPAEVETLRNTAISGMMLATRQYARRQIKWIRNQFLPVVTKFKADDVNPSMDVFLLDTGGK